MNSAKPSNLALSFVLSQLLQNFNSWFFTYLPDCEDTCTYTYVLTVGHLLLHVNSEKVKANLLKKVESYTFLFLLKKCFNFQAAIASSIHTLLAPIIIICSCTMDSLTRSDTFSIKYSTVDSPQQVPSRKIVDRQTSSSTITPPTPPPREVTRQYSLSSVDSNQQVSV